MTNDTLPKPIQKLIEQFERLPGIGPKTAQRLVFHLLHFPKEEVLRFSDALVGLKDNIQFCSLCKNVSESEICDTCSSYNRNKRLIAVVSTPMDALALERSGFKGVFHVLHGLIDPLNNLGPDDIFINELLTRIKDLAKTYDIENMMSSDQIEIILATNMSMEGESTAMYITKMLRDNSLGTEAVKISRIARGLPAGGDIEYADDVTLFKALEGRQSM